LKEKLIQFFSMVCCLVLLASLVGAAAFGDGSGSITVEYPYPGTEFRLYKVADIAADGSYVKTAKFASVPVVLGPDAGSNPGLADTLAGYVYLMELPADAIDGVGWSNTASFSPLGRGLYLVMSGRFTVGGRTYIALPLLVSIPAQAPDSGEDVYDLTLAPKVGVITDPEEHISIKVLKIWDDSQMSAARPDSIEVSLFCDGDLYDSATISARDNWRWVWTELEDGHIWTVAEKAIDSYTVRIEQNGDSFAITNSYQPTPSPTPTPSPSPIVSPSPTPTPSPSPGAKPSPTPVVTPTPLPTPTVPPYIPPYPILPQTGQLWWPVPVLAGLGLVLLLLGMILDRRQEDEIQ